MSDKMVYLNDNFNIVGKDKATIGIVIRDDGRKSFVDLESSIEKKAGKE